MSPPLARKQIPNTASFDLMVTCRHQFRTRDPFPQLKAKTAADVRRLFRRLDDDGDGLIGRKDFKVGRTSYEWYLMGEIASTYF